MLMKEGISIIRVPCKLPNVCVVDVKGEDVFRLIGVYAPDSKTWLWDDLSHFLSKKCIIYGDSNVNTMQDGKKAEILFQWADDQFLAQALPNSSTSLRSNRVIDDAFIRGFNIDIQVYNAADYYEEFFKASNIVRPHPYTDSPAIECDNINEVIPESVLPSAWKDTRMILLAKKYSICLPSLTRPISLLDSFQKIGEKLFLTRFRDLLYRRGLLPDSQSGFRERFRLQTRLLLFLEDIYSLMSNSAPVCTMFVDFRAAFDQLWFLGCIGKLRNLGIPSSFLNWIEVWLNNRCCFLEINGSKSRRFSIEKGGP
ncbi:unnamed protein product [Rotaria socialis]|uniref:Reverse transcriptase domain-containing protein n=1 Tax=Rotaria socialis TaxID=392032 RepID=A0A820XPC1_9BILA|nr:unnamed protein product [Rotaria socialis]